MNTFDEYILPPNVYRGIKEEETEIADVKAYLEIEVSCLNFITDNSYNNNNNIYNNKSYCTKNTTQQKHKLKEKKLSSTLQKNVLSRGVIAKIIWWGEESDAAGSVSISCVDLKRYNLNNNCNNNRNNYNNLKKATNTRHIKQCQQQQQKHQPEKQKQQCQKHKQERSRQQHKLRYSVRGSLELFLDYLRECPPIEIVATTANNPRDNSPHDSQKLEPIPLGRTKLPLPSLLLQKYIENYVDGNNFVYKTKIYALYHYGKSGTASCEVQQQQQLKTGEIQLRFKMLFTATATRTPPPMSPVTAQSKVVPIIKLPAVLLQDQLKPNVVRHHKASIEAVTKWPINGFYNHMHQQQLRPKQQKEQKQQNNHNVQQQLQQRQQQYASDDMLRCNSGQVMTLMENSLSKNNSMATCAAGKSIEIMSSIKKLNLAALLAAAEKSVEQFKRLEQNEVPHNEKAVDDHIYSDNKSNNIMEKFNKVTSIELYLEALTLQAEGTKCMDLLGNEKSPITTIECQLSRELISEVKPYDMFHTMQFETEKFQNATQCAHFGQGAQRTINLQLAENVVNNNLGHITFTVWWREPGSCLNEMLGTGSFEVSELYNARIFEKCKCIAIQRRGKQLANLYLKVSLSAVCKKQELMLTMLASDGSSGSNGITAALDNDKSNDCAGTSNNNNNNGNNNSSGNQNTTGNNGDNNKSNNNAAASIDGNKAENLSQSNNNSEPETVSCNVETAKVRLLKGFIYANEMRQLQTDGDVVCSLICQPFWQQQRLVIAAGANNAFNFQEQFSVINDEKFLKSMNKQFLILEIEPLYGVVRLPLHQFFIAYRDAAITNHLCQSKLPVISIDCWAPIYHRDSNAKLGELKCLLAIGSDAQIVHLKAIRNFGTAPSSRSPTKTASSLLDLLHSALNAPAPACVVPTVAAPLKPHQANRLQTFKFALNIVSAVGLPHNPGGTDKSKKSMKRHNTAKRYAPNEPPSTYITFQADECNTKTYKSHEGLVYATNIIRKSTEPKWQCKFRVTATVEYLTNPQKLFIMKVWKKAAINDGQELVPAPLEDAIIGFAAINLNLKPEGLNTGGWFNIVDFNGRITGGVEVYTHALEDLHKLLKQPFAVATSADSVQIPSSTSTASTSSPSTSRAASSPITSCNNVDSVIDNFEQTLDLTHLNLGHAIKRKFTELEEINQSLRTRLVSVTGTPFSTQFNMQALDNWQTLKVDVDDDVDYSFENDLKTPPPTSPIAETKEIFELPHTSSKAKAKRNAGKTTTTSKDDKLKE